MFVKICGFTDAGTAKAIADMGVDAAGLVFHPKSPRRVSPRRAAEIAAVLPNTVMPVGVFVDRPFSEIIDIATNSGLRGVQLHGDEPPAAVRRLRDAGLFVIKALFISRRPHITEADSFDADAFLVECGKKAPGGTGEKWNWEEMKGNSLQCPWLLAGGITPETVQRAVLSAKPAGIDVSSGVESAPGRKDPRKAAALLAALDSLGYPHRRRFHV